VIVVVRMKKMSITVAILAAILLLALGWAWQWSRNIITIENASGKTVDAITVTVCGKSYRVAELPSGGTRRVGFDVTAGDSDFQVEVSFDDGSGVAGRFGYVTGGAGAYNNRAKIKIHPDRIEGAQEY